MRLLTSFYILCSFFSQAFGQSMEIKPGVTGYWTLSDQLEPPVSTWKAQWIWAEESKAVDLILARKSFDLMALPEKASLRITASSQYQLFINGTYICRGPARSAPHHQSYDMLDVTELLNKGLNTLAVKVHHQAGKYSYREKDRAGLLAQLDLIDHGETLSIITDENWRSDSRSSMA